MPSRHQLGGVIHTYQKYDPKQFPSPLQPPPDLATPALEHLLAFGNRRRLTEEELARAIRIDPSQIAGLGPSIDALIAMLLERKRKILEKYETVAVRREASDNYCSQARQIQPPRKLSKPFIEATTTEQLYGLERLWYAADGMAPKFARQLVPLMETLAQKYQIDEMAAKYDFRGRTVMSVPEALVIKEELDKIEELLKQLEEARQSAQIGIIDLESLSEFADPGDMENLNAMQQMVNDYLRELASQQGLLRDGDHYQLTPKAYRIFQGKLLERIFSQLDASRTGRHTGQIVGEGAVEMQQTKPYEFGDSVTQMDIPQTLINAMLRAGPALPIRLHQDDIVIHKTRNTPKCATAVIMDMSGSMRYDGQYISVKRMALALEGLIHTEYPGDYLRFIEMYSFARVCKPGEIVELMPKVVTINDPIVRLKADMGSEDISEYQVPPHFTNIQHSLQLARQLLAAQDTPNRQVILITDGLPTAHFEGSWLYLLYPPDPQTESATMREGFLCLREGITINLFLIPSWSQTEEDVRFAHRLAETTSGRVVFTAGRDLDRYVIWDYVNRRREIIA